MNTFTVWLRRLGDGLVQWLRSFMAGRYGTDKLNMTILGVGVVCAVITIFVGNPVVDLTLTVISYALMGWAIFRSFSRQTYKRYQENRRFLMLVDRIKDRRNRYFECPRCRQIVRVPRGKGKIAITCPKCKERFIKKT
jgi:hypothetical protein